MKVSSWGLSGKGLLNIAVSFSLNLNFIYLFINLFVYLLSMCLFIMILPCGLRFSHWKKKSIRWHLRYKVYQTLPAIPHYGVVISIKLTACCHWLDEDLVGKIQSGRWWLAYAARQVWRSRPAVGPMSPYCLGLWQAQIMRAIYTTVYPLTPYQRPQCWQTWEHDFFLFCENKLHQRTT